MANKKRTCDASKTLQLIPVIPVTVINHIHYVANNMIGKSNLVEADRADIIQEMTIAVWRAMELLKDKKKFATGNAYLCKAVDLTASQIYRRRIRHKHDTPWIPIEECHTDDDDKKTAIIPAIDDFDRQILHMDIRVIVNSFPDELRLICELLMQGYSFSKIAERLNLPESTVRIWRMKAIRQAFVRNGINF